MAISIKNDISKKTKSSLSKSVDGGSSNLLRWGPR